LSHSVGGYSTAGVCAICAAELPADAKLDSLPEPRFGLNRSMCAGLNAPAEARRAVVSLPLLEPAREKLALLVSELVSNSTRHAGLSAGDPIDMELSSENGQVWIAVHDSGPGFDPQGPSNGEDPGFGLAIVAALADRWGVDRGPDGCTVWCSLQTEEITA
jgi:anti-sigma regulatory factor (Ser/Thr protein kinase)